MFACRFVRRSAHRATALAHINGEIHLSGPRLRKAVQKMIATEAALQESPGYRDLTESSSSSLRRMSDQEVAVEIAKRQRVYENKVGMRAQLALISTAGLIAYFLFMGYQQIGDANSPVQGVILKLLKRLEPDTAIKVVHTLAEHDSLPTDYASEDPYLVRQIQLGEKTKTLYYPIGVEGVRGGLDSWARLGFGCIEIDAERFPGFHHRSSGDPLSKFSLIGLKLKVDQHTKFLDSYPVDYVTLEFENREALLKACPSLNRPFPIGIMVSVSAFDSEVCEALAGSKGVSGVVVSGNGENRQSLRLLIKSWSEGMRTPQSSPPLIFYSGSLPPSTDYLDLIEWGASVVQSPDLLTFGARTARRAKSQISDRLWRRGYVTLDEAVGADGNEKSKRRREFEKKKRKF